MTAFGISPLGTALGPFGGPGLITLLGVLPESRNTFIVVFDKEPRSLDTQSPFSGVNPDSYVLEAIDPTVVTGNGQAFVPAGAVVPAYSPNVVVAEVDDDDPTQIILSTDADLEAGAQYRVTVSTAIRTVAGDIFAGPNELEFYGRRPSRVPSPIEIFESRYRDFAYELIPNPDSPDDPVQVYRFDDSGDIGIQENDRSLRKRIFRRIFTKPGDYVFLPNYGVGLRLKTLIKAGRLQEASNAIAEQIKQEPDVLNAGAATSLRVTDRGAVVVVEVQVVQDDARERKFLFEFPANS